MFMGQVEMNFSCTSHGLRFWFGQICSRCRLKHKLNLRACLVKVIYMGYIWCNLRVFLVQMREYILMSRTEWKIFYVGKWPSNSIIIGWEQTWFSRDFYKIISL
jgi:hypothetical protein